MVASSTPGSLAPEAVRRGIRVGTEGKTLDFAELRVLQLRAQQLKKMGTSGCVVLEGQAEAFHRAVRLPIIQGFVLEQITGLATHQLLREFASIC